MISRSINQNKTWNCFVTYGSLLQFPDHLSQPVYTFQNEKVIQEGDPILPGGPEHWDIGSEDEETYDTRDPDFRGSGVNLIPG